MFLYNSGILTVVGICCPPLVLPESGVRSACGPARSAAMPGMLSLQCRYNKVYFSLLSERLRVMTQFRGSYLGHSLILF